MMQSGKKLDDKQLKKVSGGCGQDEDSAFIDEDRDGDGIGSANGTTYTMDRDWSFALYK